MNTHRLCVAPMMDVTDRHFRYFLRLVSRELFLYTEMVPVAALLHGDPRRHLAYDPTERPLALQLGGCDPGELAHGARLAAQAGFDEVNLNCGCPSARVQAGAFGACLMRRPALVAACVRAMHEASGLPVTVKHRLGVDADESWSFLCDFVGTVAQAGCRTFLVHARTAVLTGLSPRANRSVPPLRHEQVWRLKRAFPELEIVVNGGVATRAEIARQLAHVDGVMIGRAALAQPWFLSDGKRSREEVVAAYQRYATRELARGVTLRRLVRHLHGLLHGEPGAARWRRALSDPGRLARNDPTLLAEALAEARKVRAPERLAA